jgi:hypothetical protein
MSSVPIPAKWSFQGPKIRSPFFSLWLVAQGSYPSHSSPYNCATFSMFGLLFYPEDGGSMLLQTSRLCGIIFQKAEIFMIHCTYVCCVCLPRQLRIK